MRILRSLVLIAVLAGAAQGDEPPPTPEAVAERVQAAWEAKDDEAMRALAKAQEPDPWLVADALLARGAREAAAAFAGAAPRKDVERLPAFVAAWKATDGDAAARARIETVNAALGAQKHADALAALDAEPGVATAIPAVRLAFGRGIALLGLGRFPESADAFAKAAAAAEEMGWLSRASQALVQRLRAEAGARRQETILEVARALATLETRRGPPSIALAFAHVAQERALESLGRLDGSVEANRKRIAVMESLGNRPGVAEGLNDQAQIHLRRRDAPAAIEAAQRALALAEPEGLWIEVMRSRLVVGSAHRSQRRWTPAVEALTAAHAAAEKAQDREGAARAALDLGATYGDRGEPDDHRLSVDWGLRAAAAYEALGTRFGQSIALSNVADSLVALGKRGEARPHVERAVAVAREGGAAWAEARALAVLGQIEEEEERHAEALAAFAAAVARFREAGDRVEAARSEASAAEAHRALGDLAKARERADHALREAEAIGDPRLLSFALRSAARVRRDQGQREEALALARRSLEQYRAIGSSRGVKDLEALVQELESSGVRPP